MGAPTFTCYAPSAAARLAPFDKATFAALRSIRGFLRNGIAESTLLAVLRRGAGMTQRATPARLAKSLGRLESRGLAVAVAAQVWKEASRG